MMRMIEVSLVLALMTLWTSSNALGRSNYQHLHVGTKNQDQLLLAQSSKPSSFPFSGFKFNAIKITQEDICLLYTSPSPRDVEESRMPSSA